MPQRTQRTLFDQAGDGPAIEAVDCWPSDVDAGGTIARAGPGPCWWCKHEEWWRSIHGVLICGWCHPPVTLQVVAEWIGGKPG